MKIISITTIKNEADIIESFVRYHLNIMDLMIFLDNGSTDDTLNILNQLKKENLPIEVIIDEDKYFEPFIKYNYLLKVALNDFSADIICPLDCDEFIISDYDNPRKLIEEISDDSYYKVKWRTYVPTSKDNENIKFIPSRITNIRDEILETNYKVIITKDLINKFGIKLSIGNHDVDIDDMFKHKINCIDDTKLKIAHFPLRSVNQTKSKVLLGYPNTLSRNTVVKGTSFHYEVMFNKIRNNNELSMDDVTNLAKKYSLDFDKISSDYSDVNQINLKKLPVNLNFCENLDIKYSFIESPFNNLLDNYIYFAREINRFKNKSNDINHLEGIVAKLEGYCEKLKENNLQLKDENFKLNDKINKINNEFEEIKERNIILTKTKTQLSREIVELKEVSSNQQKEINRLKNKKLKDYVKDIIR
ncbi:MAG: glycosyltransferase family 2 protein [Methanobrevibacter sp.]|nr:glycosyltransferase family 2 protein [Methanobrevibacter sp.]